MKAVLSVLALLATGVLAQGEPERCDAPYPNVFCNTTEILKFQSDSCSSYHIFLARGSDEPYPGRLGNITREICKSIGSNDCTFENIKYPAKSTAWGKDEWCKSAGKGAAAGQSQMKSYSQKCPNSKLILLGFSQGAAVAQDILGGGGGKVFECEQQSNPALDPTTAPGSNSKPTSLLILQLRFVLITLLQLSQLLLLAQSSAREIKTSLSEMAKNLMAVVRAHPPNSPG